MKTREYYLALEYEIIFRKISKEDGGGYFAYYKDFRGVMGDGETMDEAMDDVKSAFASFVEVALENHEEIKEPQHLERSKRINITIPENILNKIDKYVKSHNINRSAFFKESALKAMG